MIFPTMLRRLDPGLYADFIKERLLDAGKRVIPTEVMKEKYKPSPRSTGFGPPHRSKKYLLYQKMVYLKNM